jgi:hypothetical protein
VYTRSGLIRCVAPQADLAALRASEFSGAVTRVRPRWLELDPSAAALGADAMLARLGAL